MLTSSDGRKYFIEKTSEEEEEKFGGKKGGKGGGARGKGDTVTTMELKDQIYEKNDEQVSLFIKLFLPQSHRRRYPYR